MRQFIIAYFENCSRGRKLSVAFLLVLLVGLSDYLTGPELSSSIFYFFPIFFVAWFSTKKEVIITSFVCAGFWLTADLLGQHAHSHPLVPAWNTTVRLAVFLAFGVTLSFLKARIAHELDMASDVQRAFAPEAAPDFHDYQFSFALRPSHELAGDYVDFLPLDGDRLSVCIADASGHGVSAALLVANLQSLVRVFSQEAHAPDELCRRANRFIANSHGNFVSLFYATIDHAARRLVYTNAGHEHPIVVRADGTHERFDRGGPLLGVRSDSDYNRGEVGLEPGLRLVLYTDGVVELRNRSGEEFGFGRLLRAVVGSREASASDIQQRVTNELTAFNRGVFQDDVTVLVMAVP